MVDRYDKIIHMNLTSEDIVSIREDYKKTLKLPVNINNNFHQFFLCTVGLVGAGKSTVIKPLSDKLSLVRISSDEIRQVLKERNVGYENLMEIIKPLVEELSIQGYSIAFDADCGNPRTKEMILNLAEKTGAKVFWINIDPPEEFILNKLQNYNHTWLFKDSEDAINNYFRQKSRREEENTQFDFLTTIDTSKANLSDQIEECLKMIMDQIKR